MAHRWFWFPAGPSPRKSSIINSPKQDLTPELTAWIVEQSLSTPPLMAAAHIADVGFANYQAEAERVDADIPSLFFVATHWAETARPYLAEHCPNSRVEAFGGHMMFWEYPERFNAILTEFLATTG